MIIGVSLRVDDRLYTAKRPCRHHHLIKMAIADGCLPPVRGEQGFVSNQGAVILSREDALLHAVSCGQVVLGYRDVQVHDADNANLLFSEDVW